MENVQQLKLWPLACLILQHQFLTTNLLNFLFKCLLQVPVPCDNFVYYLQTLWRIIVKRHASIQLPSQIIAPFSLTYGQQILNFRQAQLIKEWLITGGCLWQVLIIALWMTKSWCFSWVVTQRSSLLWEVVAYKRRSLVRGGCLWEVVAYETQLLMRGGRLWEMVTYDRWLFMRDGRLREVVTYKRWSLTRDGHLWKMVIYERRSLKRGGCLWEVVGYKRPLLMRGGRLWEAVAYERWSLMRGGRLWEAIVYGRWSLMTGGHLWEMVA